MPHRWLVKNAEVRQRESKTKRRSRVRSTKWGFVKKKVGGFRYKPRGDWSSFAKVRKLCFLCSCKQTWERLAYLTGVCGTHTSYVICRNADWLYSPPGAMWGTFYCGWMHFIYFWTVEKNTCLLQFLTLGRARIIFNIHCPPKVWKRPRKVGFWTISA